MPINNRWPLSSPDQTDPMRANFAGTSSGAKRQRLGTWPCDSIGSSRSQGSPSHFLATSSLRRAKSFGFDAVEHSQRKDNHKARRAFRSEPDLAARPWLRVTRSEIAIHEFGRHRHHDQSKNPAHHTTGSKLAPRRAVLKFNLDAIYRSTMQTMAHRRTISVDVRFLL